jgi:CheY-like chemotaxis protein
MMGGHIEVESKLGLGSRFFFTVPFRVAETEAHEAATYEAAPSGTAGSLEVNFDSGDINILLAEDNKANQILMVKLLEKKKLNVDIAENGQIVLSKLKEKQYDLILMDIQMPVMDGYETALAIRREEADLGRHIPIIALTANATEEDRNRCLQTGMDDYLTKPVKSEKLYYCLHRFIKNHY